jgi:hypothetical protein
LPFMVKVIFCSDWVLEVMGSFQALMEDGSL